VDLAALLATQVNLKHPLKAAVVAGNVDKLIANLQELEQILHDSPPASGEISTNPYQEIWVGNRVYHNRVGFLFPGQGSQRLNMARTLVERFDWAQQLVQQADQWLEEIGCEPISHIIYRAKEKAADKSQLQQWLKELSASQVASPGVCLASVLWLEYLKRLGIEPKVVGGHSLGELTAFYVAGAYDLKTLIQFAAIRGKALANSGSSSGTMASLGCDRSQAQAIVDQVQGYLVVANFNSPTQTVISGEIPSIEQAMELAQRQNIQARKLPVANAFHSEIVQEAAEYVKNHAPVSGEFLPSEIPVFSSTNGQQITSPVPLKEHFSKQIVNPVNFVRLITEITKQCDVLLEVGSGRVLSSLSREITAQNFPSFSVESKSQTYRNFNIFLGKLFIANGKIKWAQLYSNRLVRDFIPAKEKVFIENPCERNFEVSNEEINSLNLSYPPSPDYKNNLEGLLSSHQYVTADFSGDYEENFTQTLTNYFQDRSNFLAELIQADLENLPLFSNHDDRP
jgi:malonyl CoA-acyl carrier protein transacylase